MFFESGWALLRTGVVGLSAYVGLVILLRILGKRTLSKMNAFDLVVTVALGSTLASTITSKQVALADGLLACGVLIFAQYAVARASVRFPWAQRLAKSEPSLLFYDGQFLRGTMRQQRVTEEEIRSAVRQQGHLSLDGIEAVVLEPGADFSIIARQQSAPERSTLKDVQGAEAHPH